MSVLVNKNAKIVILATVCCLLFAACTKPDTPAAMPENEENVSTDEMTGNEFCEKNQDESFDVVDETVNELDKNNTFQDNNSITNDTPLISITDTEKITSGMTVVQVFDLIGAGKRSFGRSYYYPFDFVWALEDGGVLHISFGFDDYSDFKEYFSAPITFTDEKELKEIILERHSKMKDKIKILSAYTKRDGSIDFIVTPD